MDTMYTPSEFSSFPWMEFAFQEFGQREIRGSRENPQIQKYFTMVSVAKPHDDTTAWCSAFVNWCMASVDIRGTGRANARSWLTWSNNSLGRPVYGAIAVFWRNQPNSWEGHVGFYVGENGANLLILGGNQGVGEVSVKPYPRSRLLGYRWPQGVPLPSA